jgi:hypothetical protein
MRAVLLQAEGVLHGDALRADGRVGGRRLLMLLAFILFCGCFYGAAMGMWGGVRGDRWMQILYSAVKVPLLLLVTFAISLPSFFVLNNLMGVRDDFPRVLRALVGTQAALTIVLASLAPLTVVWYRTSGNYQAAILFNALMFAVASFASQHLLRGTYRVLIARRPQHRLLLRCWLMIYAFVGIQMGWVLRPFIGSVGVKVEFFRGNAWGNAYVELTRIFLNLLRSW